MYTDISPVATALEIFSLFETVAQT